MQHGLYLNGMGQELVTKQVVSQINKVFGNRTQAPISLI